MGNTYAVSAWVREPGTQCSYYDREVYCGESLWRAAIAAIKAKRKGSGCVKLEWR